MKKCREIDVFIFLVGNSEFHTIGIRTEESGTSGGSSRGLRSANSSRSISPPSKFKGTNRLSVMNAGACPPIKPTKEAGTSTKRLSIDDNSDGENEEENVDPERAAAQRIQEMLSKEETGKQLAQLTRLVQDPNGHLRLILEGQEAVTRDAAASVNTCCLAPECVYNDTHTLSLFCNINSMPFKVCITACAKTQFGLTTSHVRLYDILSGFMRHHTLSARDLCRSTGNATLQHLVGGLTTHAKFFPGSSTSDAHNNFYEFLTMVFKDDIRKSRLEPEEKEPTRKKAPSSTLPSKSTRKTFNGDDSATTSQRIRDMIKRSATSNAKRAKNVEKILELPAEEPEEEDEENPVGTIKLPIAMDDEDITYHASLFGVEDIENLNPDNVTEKLIKPMEFTNDAPISLRVGFPKQEWCVPVLRTPRTLSLKEKIRAADDYLADHGQGRIISVMAKRKNRRKPPSDGLLAQVAECVFVEVNFNIEYDGRVSLDCDIEQIKPLSLFSLDADTEEDQRNKVLERRKKHMKQRQETLSSQRASVLHPNLNPRDSVNPRASQMLHRMNSRDSSSSGRPPQRMSILDEDDRMSMADGPLSRMSVASNKFTGAFGALTFASKLKRAVQNKSTESLESNEQSRPSTKLGKLFGRMSRASVSPTRMSTARMSTTSHAGPSKKWNIFGGRPSKIPEPKVRPVMFADRDSVQSIPFTNRDSVESSAFPSSRDSAETMHTAFTSDPSSARSSIEYPSQMSIPEMNIQSPTNSMKLGGLPAGQAVPLMSMSGEVVERRSSLRGPEPSGARRTSLMSVSGEVVERRSSLRTSTPNNPDTGRKASITWAGSDDEMEIEALK